LFGYAERSDRGGFGLSYQELATSFQCAVPRTTDVTLLYQAALRKMNRREEALSVVEEALDRAPDPELATYRDRLQLELMRPISTRFAALRAAAALAPRAWRVRRQLAFVALGTGDLDLAEREYSALLEAGVEFRASCEGRAEVQARRHGLDAKRDTLDVCVARAPDKWSRAHFLNQAAVARRDLGDFRRAMEQHDAARAEIGDAAWILLEFGKTAELAGDPESAAKLYEKVTRGYPREPAGRIALAGLRLDSGQVDRALEVLKPVARLRDAGAHEALLGAYLRAGDFPGFEKVVAENPGFEQESLMARAYFEDRGDLVAAAAAVERLVAAYPLEPGAHELLGRVRLESGHPAEALMAFERALALESGHVSAQLGRSRAWAALGDVDRAEKYARARLAAMPDDGASWLALAVVEPAKHGPKSAARQLRETRARYRFDEPGRWRSAMPVLEQEAELVLEARDRKAARGLVKPLREVVVYSPRRAVSWNLLARVLELAGDRPAAREAAKTAALWNPARFGASAPAAAQ
jgi:tetratricopeptide (TPR) repeat protein